MFYQTHRTPHANRQNYPPAETEWSQPLVRDVICSQRVPFRRCRGVIGVHRVFLSLMTLTFDL